MTLGDRIVVEEMGVYSAGRHPLRTYNYPNNRFVAGFIGMPPMNFFDGTSNRKWAVILRGRQDWPTRKSLSPTANPLG